jgi:hypothetical protein
MRPRHLRLAAVLAVACGLATALAFPYLLALFPQAAKSGLPLPVIVAIAAAQSGLQGLVLGWIGLRLGASLGLDAPYLRRLFREETVLPYEPFRWPQALGLGLVAGLVGGVADRFTLLPLQPERLRLLGAEVARWKGLLASTYGAIDEEIICRLFFMTVVAWGLAKIIGTRTRPVFLLASAVSAVLFGFAHLPAAAQIVPLTPIVVGRILIMNGAFGFLFGWCFWRRGLEYAMVAHFAADLVLHVVMI